MSQVMRKVLVVGSDARSHVYVYFLSKSPLVEAIYWAPANGGIVGMDAKVMRVEIPVTDHGGIVKFCLETGITVVVVSPEDPLVNGLANKLADAGIKCFGPERAGAMLEGSKSFCKEVLMSATIPTAPYVVFDDHDEARAYLRKNFDDDVIKADGLCAGKGVTVPETLAEALAAIDEMVSFGDAGKRVLIEKRLRGTELSVMFFVDGDTHRVALASQDHKRRYRDDKGKNTGGMGACCPVPIVTPELMIRIDVTIIRPLLAELAKRGIVYRGIIYLGLMITKEGPQVLEINCRGGDPEMQVVLPLMKTDFAEVVEACVTGTLDQIDIVWGNEFATCIVLVSAGYPDSAKVQKGNLITGLDTAKNLFNTFFFHAGTRLEREEVKTNGGRVISVVGLGSRYSLAFTTAMVGANVIDFADKDFRDDIGLSIYGPVAT